MDEREWRADAAPAEPGTVGDCTCHKCGYLLRGLSRVGKCPECGEAVGASLDPKRLIHADPSRLRLVQLGYMGIALAPIVVVIMWIVLSRATISRSQFVDQALFILGVYGSGCLMLAGTPYSRTDTALASHTHRKWLRWLGVTTTALVVVSIAAISTRNFYWIASSLTLLLAACLWATRGLIHLAQWLARLADRSDIAEEIALLLYLQAFAAAGATVMWIGFALPSVGSLSSQIPSSAKALSGVTCFVAPLMIAGVLFAGAFLVIGWLYSLAVVGVLQGVIRSARELRNTSRV